MDESESYDFELKLHLIKCDEIGLAGPSSSSEVPCFRLQGWSSFPGLGAKPSEGVDYQPRPSSSLLRSVPIFPQSFVLCFSNPLLNTILEDTESKVSGLCWQIADALIRWMKLIETKVLLGVEWGVKISAEREGTRKRATTPILQRTRALLYPQWSGCREIYLDEFVNQDWIMNLRWVAQNLKRHKEY